MSSADVKKTIVRQQLSTVVDLGISPARIRTFMDSKWVNRSREEKNNGIKQLLDKIKKEGCPVKKPMSPKSPGKNADAKEKKKYEEEKAVYAKQLKEYKSYSSPKYTELKVLHGYCKNLNKLHALLLRERRTEATEYEITSVLAVLDDKAPPRKTGESGESLSAYEARLSKFKAKGYVEVRSDSADFSTPEGVEQEITRVMKENPDLSYFLSKDGVSKERVRFNDPAAVALAAFMESAIEELSEHTIAQTLAMRRARMQPDHCVSEGVEDCSLYPLICNLPHYLAIVERQGRKLAYEEKKASQKQRNIQKAKMQANREKKSFVRPKFTYPSFNDVEVENGYAMITEVVKDGAVKKLYQWYDIDIERDPEVECDDADMVTGYREHEDADLIKVDKPLPKDEFLKSWREKTAAQSTDFKSYVSKVCKRVLGEHVDSGDKYAEEVSISSNLKKFFSDLIIDFVTRVTPLAMLLMESKGVKTVSEDIVLTVVKQILIDSYRRKSAYMTLNEQHAKMFSEVEKKIKLCQEHQTHVVHKEPAHDQTQSVAEDEPSGHESDPTQDLDAEPAERAEPTEPEEVEEKKKTTKRTVVRKAKPAPGVNRTAVRAN